MPKLCYDTLATLPNRPHFERFRASVEQMLAARGDDIAFMRFVQTDMDVFPYSKTEWQKMFEDYHLLLLEAMKASCCGTTGASHACASGSCSGIEKVSCSAGSADGVIS